MKDRQGCLLSYLGVEVDEYGLTYGVQDTESQYFYP